MKIGNSSFKRKDTKEQQQQQLPSIEDVLARHFLKNRKLRVKRRLLHKKQQVRADSASVRDRMQWFAQVSTMHGVRNACAADTPPPGGKTKRPSTSAAGPSTNGVSENGADKRGGDAKNAKVKTLLIMDARSALAAWANRGKGGGCESASEFKTNSLQIKVPSHHVSCWRISMS